MCRPEPAADTACVRPRLAATVTAAVWYVQVCAAADGMRPHAQSFHMGYKASSSWDLPGPPEHGHAAGDDADAAPDRENRSAADNGGQTTERCSLGRDNPAKAQAPEVGLCSSQLQTPFHRSSRHLKAGPGARTAIDTFHGCISSITSALCLLALRRFRFSRGLCLEGHVC